MLLPASKTIVKRINASQPIKQKKAQLKKADEAEEGPMKQEKVQQKKAMKQMKQKKAQHKKAMKQKKKRAAVIGKRLVPRKGWEADGWPIGVSRLVHSDSEANRERQ